VTDDTIYQMTRETSRDDPSIVQYWHSDEMPAEIEALTASFRELNPDLRHRIFCEAEARQFIADRFTRSEVAAFDSCAVPAMQADYFRYCAVLAFGGVYSDADFRCIQPLRGLIEKIEGGLLFRREPRGNLVNGFFAFHRPGHPLLRIALDVATANIERRAAKRVNAVTGPLIFTCLSALHRAGSMDAARRLAVDASMRRLVEPMLDVIDDYTQVAEAFEDVKIEPFETAGAWVVNPNTTPEYKLGNDHWVNWHERRGSIFR
jgi:mannosyltransferase OCH1-like enzyme